MAFGVGALISSASFELVLPSVLTIGIARVSLALLLGTVAFYLVDILVDRLVKRGRSSPDEMEHESSGLGIMLGAVLNGIPEAAVLGMSLATGQGVSAALAAAIWISNFPESISATEELEASGTPKRHIRLVWWGVLAISAVSAAVGFAIISLSNSRADAYLQAFAAGAVLILVANQMIPGAYARAARATGLLTSLGFIFGLFLTGVH